MEISLTKNILRECRNSQAYTRCNEPDSVYICQFCNKQVSDENTTRVESVFKRHLKQQTNITVELLQCPNCDKDVAVCHKDYWLSVSDHLQGSAAFTGIKQVQSVSDRRILFLLSQVCYNQYDLDNDNFQSPFSKFTEDEVSHIIWIDGEAVGFYTVKETGSPLYDEGPEVYQLPMLDTMYVRSEFRLQGLGTKLLEDFVTRYPSQNIGFSSPVSMSLYKVLYKMLLKQPELRDRVWECEFDGSEGYRKNIWFHIRRTFKLQQRNDPTVKDRPSVEN